jgi:MFS family permease
MEMLVASRAVQGIGGGGLLTLVEVVVTDLVSIAERGAYMGIISLVWALGCVLGISSHNLSDPRTCYRRRVCWRRTMAMVSNLSS